MEDLYQKIEELTNMNPSVVNENANKNAEVFNTKRDLLAGIVSKNYALNKLLPKEIAEAHLEGIIHFHDLDYFPMIPYFNCMLIDFKGMLEKGFRIGGANIESPKSINTATALVAQIVANVSSNIYGGTSFNRADEVLAPYAKLTFKKWEKVGIKYFTKGSQVHKFAKEMTIKSIYDAMQSLEYELNTLYNANGQTPFFTLNFGLGRTWFAREIQKAILNIRIKGLGADGKTAVFPKLVFTLKKGVNLRPIDPNYDIKQLALECTTKRMYPDVVMYDKVVEITGDFKSPMGCRSFLSSYKRDGKFVTDGRMNMGVVSLNLPNIAINTSNPTAFFNLLYERLFLCKRAMDFRIETLKNVKAKNAPILYMYGATGYRLNPEDSVFDIFKDGYASISLGYIGIYEAVAKFYGGDWYSNKQAVRFSKSILDLMHHATEEWKKENGFGYSVYGTPSESLCDRFCRLDKKKYGEIENITDKDWYTNSFHYDVRKKVTPFEKIEFESHYAKYSSGGCIHYAEFPNLIKNVNALEQFWNYCYDKVDYLGTNTPIDKCYECGFEGEFNATSHGFECPNCENHDASKSNCTRRLCGYLGNPNEIPPIHGKLEEIKSRVKHI